MIKIKIDKNKKGEPNFKKLIDIAKIHFMNFQIGMMKNIIIHLR